MKPRIALLFHRFGSRENAEQMHMVWHHDEIAHEITLTIEVQERVGDDLRELGPPAQTTTVARIEEFFAAAVKCSSEVRAIFLGKGIDDDGPLFAGLLVTPLTKPLLLFLFPAVDDLARNRIVGPKCDEDNAPACDQCGRQCSEMSRSAFGSKHSPSMIEVVAP
jgi:hypothetical protein